MTNKQYGTAKERELRKRLEKEGYYVTRAGGSLGIFDLIALGMEKTLLIQVKATHGKYLSYKKDLEAMQKFQAPPNSYKVVYEWKNREWTSKVIP